MKHPEQDNLLRMSQMIPTIRQKYKELEVELTTVGYVDVATGEALSLSALSPDLGLTDDQCHPVLLMATEPVKAADAGDISSNCCIYMLI